MGDIGVCLKIWYSKFQTNLISFIIIFPQFATSFGAAKSIEQLVLPFLAFLARPGQAKSPRSLPDCQERPIHGDVWENTWLLCGFYMGIVCLWVLYGLDMAFHMAFIWLSYGFLNGSYMVSLWVLNGFVIMCIYIVLHGCCMVLHGFHVVL
jgi:hypothetical protein